VGCGLYTPEVIASGAWRPGWRLAGIAINGVTARVSRQGGARGILTRNVKGATSHMAVDAIVSLWRCDIKV